ncbi:MAG TPA: hypothetical protein VMX58_12735 [Patescibacteria group bacterium]|nr:hypothetical protein [Patescibacteria group bacterium]
MYCKYCGKEISGLDEYCVHCGKQLKIKSDKGLLYRYELFRLKAPKEKRSPGVAAAIGFFCGWIFLGPVGYIYLQQWNWFWITFLVQIIAYPLTGIVPAYILLPIVYGIHQYQMANDLNAMLQDGMKARGEDAGEEMPERPAQGESPPLDQTDER